VAPDAHVLVCVIVCFELPLPLPLPVISFMPQEQNESKKFREKGLDIVIHRKKMVSENLETLFKDSISNFQIVFVCNMWMTGFDVPSLSTIYLDKPNEKSHFNAGNSKG
jgi:hypothetical protein